MKIPKPFLFLFAICVALGALTPRHASAQVTVSFFYDSLSPYGEWVEDPDYGYVWHPTNVDDNWAPYTDGYWAYTDAGWTWVSYEDYGGVVYHYGRWAHVRDEGWVWVPGEVWAPAWVSWRSNDSYIGWAPLPPEARWRVGVGFGGWVDARFDIGPGCYSFVGVGDFGAPALGAVILGRDRNVEIINNTTNITNITVNNSTVYTGGPRYAEVAAHSTRPIPTLKLVRQSDAAAIHGAGGKVLSRQVGNQLVVLAPHVATPASGKLPAPPHVARTLTGATADHGWDVVKDPGERASMESKFKASAGTTFAPAKAVNPEEVKVVSDKIKANVAAKSLAKTTEATGEGPVTKTPKKKTEDLSALENAPATGSEPSATPKTGKGKKSHKVSPDSGLTGGGSADETPAPKVKKSKISADSGAAGGGFEDETPAPKVKKSKKSETPPDYDSEETPKHAKSDDSGLKPFLGSDEGTKSGKSYDEESKPSGEGYKAKESDTYGAGPGLSGEPKGEGKTGKGDKKKKSEDGYTPGPGQ